MTLDHPSSVSMANITTSDPRRPLSIQIGQLYPKKRRFFMMDGHSILMELIILEDTILFVASSSSLEANCGHVRIPVPPASLTSYETEILNCWTAEHRYTMESEIAIMRFVAFTA